MFLQEAQRSAQLPFRARYASADMQGQGTGMAAMPAAPPTAPASQDVLQQIQMVEQLAEAMTGSSATQEQRNAARTQLNEMGTNVSHIPLIRAVLDHSTNSSAQQVACNSLTRLVDDYWTSYSTQQRIELRKCSAFRRLTPH